MIRGRWPAAAAVVALVAIFPAASASADTSPLCSRVEYRTKHLRECNVQDNPVFFGGTGGDGRDGGLIGSIIDTVGDLLGGIF